MAVRALEIKGTKEADEKFRKLALVLDPKVVTSVLFNAAKVMRSSVERFAPRGITSKKPGTLKRAVMVRPMAVKAGKPAGAIVIVNYSPRRGVVAPHAHLVEGGTRAHIIRAKPGHKLKLFGGKIFRESIDHPGSKPNPFFKSGIAASRTQARNFVRTELTNLIEDAAK